MNTVEKKNLLVCCTGSVATIKLCVLLEQLLAFTEVQLDIRVIFTEHALHFCELNNVPKNVKIYRDQDEWSAWSGRGDPVLHIDLAKWADMMLIAPLDANTLAKMAQGLCDNLLTCAIRAWDLKKPLLFCPAMNTRMWDHPITATHINTLKSWGYQEIPCIAKTLICGDTGLGAMAEVDTIVQCVHTELLKVK